VCATSGLPNCHNLNMLVLASASPRRRELLTQAGFSFQVQAAHIPEDPYPNEDPIVYVVRLARQKAQAVFDQLSASTANPPETAAGAADNLVEEPLVVLGADTTVTLDNHILGKPEDAADAARMLRLLSGRTHRVITGVAVVTAKFTEVAAEVTAVRFLTLSDDEIAAYIATSEPMDKAGAYAIQGRAARWIPRIEGDYFNVVGLPIALVSTLLESYKLPVLEVTMEDEKKLVFDWVNLPVGATEESLWDSLHDADLKLVTSNRLDRTIQLVFDIQYLREFHKLPEDMRFLLLLNGVRSARITQSAPWPGEFYAPKDSSREIESALIADYQSKWRDESFSWSEFEAKLSGEHTAEVYSAAYVIGPDGGFALRLVMHVDDETYPELFLHAEGLTILKNDGESLSLEQFLKLGESYWEAFAARGEARRAGKAENSEG